MCSKKSKSLTLKVTLVRIIVKITQKNTIMKNIPILITDTNKYIVSKPNILYQKLIYQKHCTYTLLVVKHIDY